MLNAQPQQNLANNNKLGRDGAISSRVTTKECQGNDIYQEVVNLKTDCPNRCLGSTLNI